MSFSSLFRECRSKLNLSTQDSAVESFLKREINRAAEELWNTCDLDSSVMECCFIMYQETDPTTGITENSITLPNFVGDIRGFRRYGLGQIVKPAAMTARYQSGNWFPANMLTWRVKYTGPQSLWLDNVAPLKLYLEYPQSEEVTVTINGAGEFANKIEENVTFAVGETEKITTNSFTPLGVSALYPINAILKDKVTTCDLIVKDVNEKEISRIPNNLFFARFQLVNITDMYLAQPINYTVPVDCLFKTRYQPLYYDSDTFCSNAYDNVILWKVLSNNASSKEVADAYNKQYRNFVTQLTANQELAIIKPINVGPGRQFGRDNSYDRRNSQYFGFPWRNRFQAGRS
jgi:hypothetical protein